jgi:ABC-2 type transport system permease protein
MTPRRRFKLAVAWCAAIAEVGYFWAQKLYNRGTAA